MSWGAVCTCSARASVLHTLSFARTYRSNGKQHRSQIRRSHAYNPNLSAFGVAVPVGRRLHAPEAESFFDMGSPVLGNFELGTPNSVHGCTLARPTYLAPYELGGWGALCTCSARESVFGHMVLFLPLQAKWWVPLMLNLRVTCIQPQSMCFRGYRPMGLPFQWGAGCTRQRQRLREPGPEKFIREGSSGSRKL